MKKLPAIYRFKISVTWMSINTILPVFTGAHDSDEDAVLLLQPVNVIPTSSFAPTM